MTIAIALSVMLLLVGHAVAVRAIGGDWPKLQYDFRPSLRRRALDDVLRRYETGEFTTADEGLEAYRRKVGGSYFVWGGYIDPIFDAAWRETCRRCGWRYTPLGWTK